MATSRSELWIDVIDGHGREVVRLPAHRLGWNAAIKWASVAIDIAERDFPPPATPDPHACCRAMLVFAALTGDAGLADEVKVPVSAASRGPSGPAALSAYPDGRSSRRGP